MCSAHGDGKPRIVSASKMVEPQITLDFHSEQNTSNWIQMIWEIQYSKLYLPINLSDIWINRFHEITQHLAWFKSPSCTQAFALLFLLFLAGLGWSAAGADSSVAGVLGTFFFFEGAPLDFRSLGLSTFEPEDPLDLDFEPFPRRDASPPLPLFLPPLFLLLTFLLSSSFRSLTNPLWQKKGWMVSGFFFCFATWVLDWTKNIVERRLFYQCLRWVTWAIKSPQMPLPETSIQGEKGCTPRNMMMLCGWGYKLVMGWG